MADLGQLKKTLLLLGGIDLGQRFEMQVIRSRLYRVEGLATGTNWQKSGSATRSLCIKWYRQAVFGELQKDTAKANNTSFGDRIPVQNLVQEPARMDPGLSCFFCDMLG